MSEESRQGPEYAGQEHAQQDNWHSERAEQQQQQEGVAAQQGWPSIPPQPVPTQPITPQWSPQPAQPPATGAPPETPTQYLWDSPGPPPQQPWSPAPPEQAGNQPYWVSAAPVEPVPPWGSPPPPPPPPQPQPVAPPAVAPPPPAKRSGLGIGLAIGLAVAVVTGIGGFFAGHSTVKSAPTPRASASAAAPRASLRPYEASQLALNKAKLGGELTGLAQPLLPWIGGCLANGDPGGPKLQSDESRHVFCRYGGVAVHFAVFKAPAKLEVERDYRKQLNLLADGLAPGMAAPARKTGALSGAQGNYIEYAFKIPDGRALCGIWWDRDDSPTAALFMEALCEDDLGGSWEPLRDLWRRYS